MFPIYSTQYSINSRYKEQCSQILSVTGNKLQITYVRNLHPKYCKFSFHISTCNFVHIALWYFRQVGLWNSMRIVNVFVLAVALSF
jgi:hypothetical protein